VWKAYEDLAVETCGERILWITGYGATETAPSAMYTSRGAARAGTVGLPLDGLELKLAPEADKLEARFRGPSITPGYWRQPELTRAAFDEEGYYRTGDALRFVDAADARQGFEFDGRTTEDFKLGTGTWVSVGPLRAKLNAACSPLVQDVVITGHDRDRLGALVFPNLVVCRDTQAAELRARCGCSSRRAGPGSSTRITRARQRGAALRQTPAVTTRLHQPACGVQGRAGTSGGSMQSHLKRTSLWQPHDERQRPRRDRRPHPRVEIGAGSGRRPE
jgi:acyl-CoA synthetase (AMP-forming)/AMP-acid ligase II